MVVLQNTVLEKLTLISFLHFFKKSTVFDPPMVKPFRLTYLAKKGGGGGYHPLFKS